MNAFTRFEQIRPLKTFDYGENDWIVKGGRGHRAWHVTCVLISRVRLASNLRAICIRLHISIPGRWIIH